jgi:hypothetical protein
MPFPVDNLNALLAGLGGTWNRLRARFDLPTRATLQPRPKRSRRRASSKSALRTDAEIRLGVADLRMPMRTNHQRWKWRVELMERSSCRSAGAPSSVFCIVDRVATVSGADQRCALANRAASRLLRCAPRLPPLLVALSSALL